MKHLESLFALSLLAASCAAPSGSALPLAQPSAANPPLERYVAEEEHGEEHGAGTQALNLFLGGSSEFRDHDGGTLGVDYEYRVSHKWGVGGFAEVVSGLDRSLTIGAQAYWHPVGELVIVAGPGLERRKDEWEPIARFGSFYEISVGDGWVIAPAMFYDFTTGENLFIYGFNFGKVW